MSKRKQPVEAIKVGPLSNVSLDEPLFSVRADQQSCVTS